MGEGSRPYSGDSGNGLLSPMFYNVWPLELGSRRSKILLTIVHHPMSF